MAVHFYVTTSNLAFLKKQNVGTHTTLNFTIKLSKRQTGLA
ncbi:hypothetical protein LEP1GSC111_0051 [Leptospira interrogans str. UT126]|nr:hypothetical protein LEP1GSC111_0051 [Leptospira interrogans str. UT126]